MPNFKRSSLIIQSSIKDDNNLKHALLAGYITGKSLIFHVNTVNKELRISPIFIYQSLTAPSLNDLNHFYNKYVTKKTSQYTSIEQYF